MRMSMNLMPLDRLGPREIAPGLVRFGVFLPWVGTNDGNRLTLRIIHEDDQFLREIPPLDFPMNHTMDAAYGDYWSVEVGFNPADRPTPASRWGAPGTYVYRFVLESPLVPRPIDWIVDPFAREFGIGKLSAFTLGHAPHAWSADEAAWTTPPIEELIVYEIMLHEFSGNLVEAEKRLAYLADLGVNAVEVMPITNVEATLNWGFEPIGYFGVDERFGNRAAFERFVDRAHQHGVAVILDVVYGHTGAHFPYEYVYSRLGYHENPFMGSFAADMFGPGTDWNRAFVRDYFFTVNHFWLEKCHVDGYRYDCVPNYWDGPTGSGYAHLVYETYRHVARQDPAGPWRRFFAGDDLGLIQCAEQLEDPKGVVWTTYTNSTWQNATLDSARSVAHGDRGRLYDMGMRLGLDGYPERIAHSGDSIPKSAFQYIENHDHSRFPANFGIVTGDDPLFDKADRSRWFKVQPYLIGLLAGRGIPLLWQGQELAADNVVPDRGFARIGVMRPMPWEYFYDEFGRGVLRLVRRMTAIRKSARELHSGDFYLHNDWERYQSRGILLFSRASGERVSLVALNFTDADATVPFAFNRGGTWTEQIHGQDDFTVAAGDERWLHVPSNYGRIWRA
jgi:1,4-alpha-glucan branching enzyme